MSWTDFHTEIIKSADRFINRKHGHSKTLFRGNTFENGAVSYTSVWTAKTERFENADAGIHNLRRERVYLSHAQMAVVASLVGVVAYQRIRAFYCGRRKTLLWARSFLMDLGKRTGALRKPYRCRRSLNQLSWGWFWTVTTGKRCVTTPKTVANGWQVLRDNTGYDPTKWPSDQVAFYLPIHFPLYASPMVFPCLHVSILRWQLLSYCKPSAPHTGPPFLAYFEQSTQATQYAFWYWSIMHVRFLRQTTSAHPAGRKHTVWVGMPQREAFIHIIIRLGKYTFPIR